VALFRDLNQADKQAVGQEVVRRENVVSQLMLDVVRRAVTFLFLLLIASAVALLVAGAHYAYHASLFILALICFLLGLVCVGILLAINHQTLVGLVLGFAWFKFRILDSQIDTAVLNSPPPNLPKIQRLAMASGYAAFLLWVLGAGTGVAAFSVGIPTNTARVSPQSTGAVAVPQQHGFPTSRPPWNQAPMPLADEVALGALLVGLAQAVALIWTVLLARSTARRQLRAYVGPETFDLLSGTAIQPPVPAKADEPGCIVVCRNAGQTPAYDVRLHAEITVIEPKNENSLVFPPLQPALYSVLGPNVSMNSPRNLSRNLTAGEIAEIRTGARAIYVFGRIEYRDAFKKSHFTTFRMRYSGLWPLTAPASLTFAAQGNEAN